MEHDDCAIMKEKTAMKRKLRKPYPTGPHNSLLLLRLDRSRTVKSQCLPQGWSLETSAHPLKAHVPPAGILTRQGTKGRKGQKGEPPPCAHLGPAGPPTQ